MHMRADQLQLGVVQLRFIPVNIGCEVVGWSFAAHIGLPAGGKSIIAVIVGQRHAELRAVCQRAADGEAEHQSEDDDGDGRFFHPVHPPLFRK